MQSRIKIPALLSLVVLAFTMIGCASTLPPTATPGAAPSQPAAATTLPPSQTPNPPTAAAPGSPVVSTPQSVATTGGTPPATPVGTIPLTGPTQAGGLTITRDNNGQTISLHPGDRFVLSLGEEYDWTLTIDHQDVLHRVLNITPLRGSQGVYEVQSAGSAMLTAAGDPPCRQSKPACSLPSYSFELNVTVAP
jgi:hypothetical protein